MGHREMIVYHGTDSDSAWHIINDGIDLFVGDDSVDNGRGFYTTPSREFASRRAKMRTADAGVGGVVSRIRYKETRSNMDIKSVIDQIEKSDNRIWGRQVSFHSKRALKLCIQSIKAIEEQHGE